ncbi:MAG: flagellar biosynthesis protein FlhB [Lachnospiraceae bacterium]|nr:flagellar biosynthesis protein FlhB [Ruminococcus sp.]MCM1273851.1 flagellar biosynthesis protein FlhB [Lachnospiraceae bacterium]
MAGEEKTEKATPKKRRDQRKEGNVLQSKEIVTAASVLGIFAAVRLLAGFIVKNLLSFTARIYENSAVYDVNADNLMPLVVNIITVVVMVVGPVCAVAMLLGIIPTVAQTRGLFTMKALRPKFSRLNPLEGIKKLFSMQAIVGILKGLIEVIVIAYMIYSEISDRMPTLLSLMDVGLMQGLAYIGLSIFDMVMLICILLVFVAAGDFLFQWWQFEKKLKMSKQEVKEEFKQMEGDPQVKSKIKQRQQQMAQSRMMQEVPSADVIIRNPTHFAVALKYDQDKNRAPEVIAKGKDYLAMKIVEIAEKNDVMCVEDPPLARTLYAEVDIGREIPIELYNAVAEILTVVYREKNKSLHA